jgi:hypothetical protein
VGHNNIHMHSLMSQEDLVSHNHHFKTTAKKAKPFTSKGHLTHLYQTRSVGNSAPMSALSSMSLSCSTNWSA